ncbi:ATP-binding protein [Piscinibacter sakaiensis]|uniref:histidine kinase n=1 Tax=Piscinibacter sakaiensis TaxID=1547922 RepID=A0A0K8NYI8_PISS1|nr:ATP-binding protein [Piscinibacter sakaiensis]GAP35467.1 sensor histidine kinase PrrB [Piscinibacter sakaiensis]
MATRTEAPALAGGAAAAIADPASPAGRAGPAGQAAPPATVARAGAGVVEALPEPNRDNLRQLIQLRWIAVVGQVLTIAGVSLGFGIALPLAPLAAVMAGLVLFNLASAWRLRQLRPIGDAELFVALAVDVAGLTLLLQQTGGAANPFVFLYLLQVVLAAVLLQPRWAWAIAGATAGAFVLLAAVGRPLALPLDPGGGLRDPYVWGLLVCFGLCAGLLVHFVHRIGANLRSRDARLADLRQRAAEEEHVVRMGLLASGAAHELGTPLATLSVILGDWQRMPPFTRDATLRQDLDEMQGQLRRCKDIVGGILLSAGEARGEAPAQTRLRNFLDELVADWRRHRPAATLRYTCRLAGNPRVVADPALKQTLANVLDNACEAGSGHVELDAWREGEDLLLGVRDDGPGFTPETLQRLGRPYNSSKGRPGGGLGLFLVVNVLRKLGGRLEARNREAGGALVTLRLPLAAIALDDAAADPEDPHAR